MNRIIQKAINMGFDCNRAELIREKDGVTVAASKMATRTGRDRVNEQSR